MPIDLIVGYKFRPRPLKAEELAELRLALQHRSTELGEVGARLKQERASWQTEKARGPAASSRAAGDEAEAPFRPPARRASASSRAAGARATTARA